MIVIARCQVSVCGVTLKPEASSPLCTQLLYGEYCQILGNDGYYTQIQTASDNTIGWVFSQNIETLQNIPQQYIVSESFRVFPIKGHNTLISLGSELTDIPSEKKENALPKNLYDIAMQFLHTPFLSGGRSIFGVDASGFSQLVYKCFEIHLPRFAYQQAEYGQVLDFIEEAEIGDLAFFENEQKEINHVGIMLDNQRIIHCFEKVRIDDLDSTGIYNAELKKHTHFLRFIKRIMQ